MNTKEIVEEYRRLLLVSESQAEQFAAKHQNNEIFSSLVEFRRVFVCALTKAFEPRLKTIQNICQESDPAIKQILNLSLQEDIRDELKRENVISKLQQTLGPGVCEEVLNELERDDEILDFLNDGLDFLN